MNAVLKEPQLLPRPMREEHLEEVMAIEESLYPFPWTRGIFQDCLRVGYSCWVFIQGDTLDAYAVMSVGAGEAHILNICVAPRVQRQGLGRLVMKHMLSLASRRHTDTMLLEVRPSNVAALGLYRALGFNEVGMRRAYYPAEQGREDAMILAMDLNSGKFTGPW